MANPVPPKFDFTGVDASTVDPDRLGMGIGVQDCSLIAATFERAAHATPTEAAVFATLSRSLQNKKQFALAAANSVTAYLQSPAESASKILQQSGSLSGSVIPTGTTATVDQTLQGLNLAGQSTTSFGSSFGNHLLDYAKNCIPCNLRLTAFLELHPDLNLLGSLEAHIKDSMAFINGVLGLLSNFDAFGDFCSLLKLLSFMCIPDLQRIIATLMALFLLKAPTLDGLIGLLQGLVAPMFAPLLMAITSLLDQFVQLVTAPLQCVVDAITSQISALKFETGAVSPATASQIGGSLGILNAQLNEAIMAIKAKMNFYTAQVKALLGELGTGDAAYLQLKLQSLTLVRLISFVIAIITALSKGHAACDSSKPPEQSEMDNFFQNFLTPQTPFNIWIDPSGQIHIEEKTATDPSPLSATGNVLNFTGEPLVDPGIIQGIAKQLTAPTYVAAPCKLKTDVGDIDRLQQYIAQLNKA